LGKYCWNFVKNMERERSKKEWRFERKNVLPRESEKHPEEPKEGKILEHRRHTGKNGSGGRSAFMKVRLIRAPPKSQGKNQQKGRTRKGPTNIVNKDKDSEKNHSRLD